uniref:Uncharacterized protein n=1 Tax=Schlesneria paludicola TaxID=360056 RepID=A0A7C4QLS4_9PLAN
MGLPELDDAYRKAAECDRIAQLYFGMLRSAVESASTTRLERAREYGDYLLGLSIKARKAVEQVRQQLLHAHDARREYRSCRTPHPTSARLRVHTLAHDAVVAWSEHLAHILRCSWYATERDPATFSEGMRELQADLAALGEPTWTPADLEVEWTAARRLTAGPAPGPAAEAKTSDTDTRGHLEIATVARGIRNDLARDLFLAQCAAEAEGRSIAAVNREFRRKKQGKLGKTATEQRKAFNSISKTALRARRKLRRGH